MNRAETSRTTRAFSKSLEFGYPGGTEVAENKPNKVAAVSPRLAQLPHRLKKIEGHINTLPTSAGFRHHAAQCGSWRVWAVGIS